MVKRAAFYGWTLVAVLFLTDLLLMGLPYYSVINTYMLKQIHMSRSIYGLGFTVTNLFYGLPSTSGRDRDLAFWSPNHFRNWSGFASVRDFVAGILRSRAVGISP